MEYYLLKEVASYSNLRTSQIEKTSYISTENMLPNKGGITFATSIPNIYSASKYEIGDILLSNIRPYFCKIWLANKEGSCSNDVLVLRANEKVVSKFLYYVLSDKNFFNYDTVTSKGTKMPRGNKNAIMKYLVPKRNVQCQHRIASILSAYDSLIENNTKRIRLLEKMAENLYKEWFVRFRFPGHENVEMENGLPKGWKVEALENLLDIRYGKDHKKLDDGDVPIYGSGGIIRYGNTSLYNGSSVLIPRKGSLNNIIYVEGKFWTVDTMFYSVPQKNNICFYLYYVLSMVDMTAYNAGAALPSMTTAILNRMKVVLPDGDALKRFEGLLQVYYKQKRNLQHQNTLLARRRDLLLPRLMSGKLEVKP